MSVPHRNINHATLLWLFISTCLLVWKCWSMLLKQPTTCHELRLRLRVHGWTSARVNPLVLLMQIDYPTAMAPSGAGRAAAV